MNELLAEWIEKAEETMRLLNGIAFRAAKQIRAIMRQKLGLHDRD